MKIFLSWSGERSRCVASALRNWIPLLLHDVEIWLSDEDIAAGERWASVVGKQLQDCDFGIICVTRENIAAPWVLFEAGALSKTLSSAFVCPYLLGIEFQELTSPLSQFQAKKADGPSTLELIQGINARVKSPLPANRLEELFEALWPKLHLKLSAIPDSASAGRQDRPATDVLEDLVGAIRGLEHRFSALEARLTRIQLAPSGVRLHLRVVAEHEVGSVASGEHIQVSSNGPLELVTLVAKWARIEAAAFGSDWFLSDPDAHFVYSAVEDMARVFTDPPRRLVLTTIPF